MGYKDQVITPRLDTLRIARANIDEADDELLTGLATPVLADIAFTAAFAAGVTIDTVVYTIRNIAGR